MTEEIKQYENPSFLKRLVLRISIIRNAIFSKRLVIITVRYNKNDTADVTSLSLNMNRDSLINICLTTAEIYKDVREGEQSVVNQLKEILNNGKNSN